MNIIPCKDCISLAMCLGKEAESLYKTCEEFKIYYNKRYCYNYRIILLPCFAKIRNNYKYVQKLKRTGRDRKIKVIYCKKGRNKKCPFY